MARPKDALAQSGICYMHVAVTPFPFLPAQRQDFLHLSQRVCHGQHTHSLGQGNSGFSYKQTDCRKGLRGGKDDSLEKMTSYTQEVQGSTSGTLNKELLHWGAFFPFCRTVAEEAPPGVRMQAVEEVRQPRQSWLCQRKRNNVVQIKKKKKIRRKLINKTE